MTARIAALLLSVAYPLVVVLGAMWLLAEVTR